MREIKFRAWDNILNEYFSWEDSIKFNNYHDLIEDNYNGAVSLEQYTDLKDKNGVEIYEGDIVKVLDGEDVEDPYYAYLEIRYAQGKFYFHNAYAVKFDDVLDGGVLDVEVIGNIHQNKNLLVNDTDRISPDDIGNDIHDFLHGGDK